VVLALRRELEPPAAACERMFGGEAGFCAAWIGQTGMFVRLTEGTPAKITIYKDHLDRVRAFLKRIEAKSTVASGGGDNE
jgi:hypothetical protein